jgi:hypothetical protein
VLPCTPNSSRCFSWLRKHCRTSHALGTDMLVISVTISALSLSVFERIQSRSSCAELPESVIIELRPASIFVTGTRVKHSPCHDLVMQSDVGVAHLLLFCTALMANWSSVMLATWLELYTRQNYHRRQDIIMHEPFNSLARNAWFVFLLPRTCKQAHHPQAPSRGWPKGASHGNRLSNADIWIVANVLQAF